MSDLSCAFCSIIAAEEPAEVVTRSTAWVAFFPSEPATLGHTLVVPTRHVSDIWALTIAEATDLATGVLELAHVIRRALMPEGLNVVQSNGELATQTVDHLHVHLVPRWAGDAMGGIWPEHSPVFAVDDKLRALVGMRRAIEAAEQ